MTIALISNLHNIFLNDMMHTGLITAGMDVTYGGIAGQATASTSNMTKRALEELAETHKKPQGILFIIYVQLTITMFFFPLRVFL